MGAGSAQAKLWQGRTSGEVDPVTDALNRSIGFDQKLITHDIQGSIAHATMLGKQGVLTQEEASLLVATLKQLLEEWRQGNLTVSLDVEDIHTFVELELTKRLGDVGKKLHTGRSRNDQVALDLRLYTREALRDIFEKLKVFRSVLKDKAAQHSETVMPGYTHLQRAQPVTLSKHLLAYEAMLGRDKERISDCLKRVNLSPLGAGALAGSTFPLDRKFVAELLEFDAVLENSLDAVSSRDFVMETLSVLSILMTHLSRLAEELVLWSSQEFGFIRLADTYTTGSSMMPQKKNPDLAELVRAKTGRVYGSLITLLTVMKALPLAYNKDMQEDKEPLFDALETVNLSLQAMTGMIATMTVFPDAMRRACQTGFLNATDLADYLVTKGVPFREAYAYVGQAVAKALELGQTLETLSMKDYKAISTSFGEDLFEKITLESCLSARH